MTLATLSRACLAVPTLWATSARRIWMRRDLTPQERMNLLAIHTPPAITTDALGGQRPR
jgi:hypothetical protein